jgi:aspartokinase-like uncharacterized kinase
MIAGPAQPGGGSYTAAADCSELIPELTTAQLAQHAGGVEEYLPRFLATANLDTWVISGLHPERLRELLETDCTIGKKIKS